MNKTFRGILMLILTSLVATLLLGVLLTWVVGPLLTALLSSKALAAFFSCWLAVALVIAFDDKLAYPLTDKLIKFTKSIFTRLPR